MQDMPDLKMMTEFVDITELTRLVRVKADLQISAEGPPNAK